MPHGSHPVAFVVCETEVARVVKRLKEAFPPTTLHAFAAKANPLNGILDMMNKEGLGCETASIGEFAMAQKSFAPEKIVFDSPVKTLEELKVAAYLPCYLNLDNFEELARVAELNKTAPVVATIGLRINPQLGAGTIGALSTGLATSKFGIGYTDHYDDIVEAYKEHSFLKMLHVHTGSQGIGLTMMVQGVKRIVDLAKSIGPAVTVIDIGGGLPVNFASDEYKPTFEQYASALRAEVPELFEEGKYKIITEFGRAIVAKAGVFLSRVEYVKVNGGRTIVLQHVGADLCVRTVWAPKDWPLRVSLFDSTGAEKILTEENKKICDVAGPCCLGGDVTAKEYPLPDPRADDIVVHKDVGGYYHSNYSMYNLRAMPPCYIFNEDTDSLRLIRRGMSLEETLSLVMP
jgi:diaminopimelate decarboxylase